MTYITTTISREKLRLKEYEPDFVVVSDSKSTKQISAREFFVAVVELLALINLEVIRSSIN